MQKKYEGPHAKRQMNLTGVTNEYKAVIQLLGEVRIAAIPGTTVQDAIRWAIYQAAARVGVSPEEITARAAELDAADQMKAGQK